MRERLAGCHFPKDVLEIMLVSMNQPNNYLSATIQTCLPLVYLFLLTFNHIILKDGSKTKKVNCEQNIISQSS